MVLTNFEIIIGKRIAVNFKIKINMLLANCR